MTETISWPKTVAPDIRSALKDGMTRLRRANISSHTLAAELLLMHVLGHDRAWLYTHTEDPIDSSALQNYFALVSRRAAGEPTQYLTGKQEFWGLEFEVTPAVLIPRPETEHLIEVALERLGPRGIKINMRTGAPSPVVRIADVGTGSGCLAVALAHELPHAEVYATDVSSGALAVARRNAARHSVADRIHFVETDLLAAFEFGREPGFDLIVSNPPYVARDEEAALPREVRDHEPHAALFGGPTGPEIYAGLIDQSANRLSHKGTLVLELGYNSALHVLELVSARPGWARVAITNDLASVPRVLAAERI